MSYFGLKSLQHKSNKNNNENSQLEGKIKIHTLEWSDVLKTIRYVSFSDTG